MRWDQIFGANPIGVIVRLIVLSVVVGIILSALGITADNIVYRLSLLAHRIYDMGWGVFEWGFGYFLIGAIVVVPIWILSRIFGGGARRNDRN